MCNKTNLLKSNKKNKILEDAHDVKVDVKVNVVECATHQFSIMPKDLQLGEVEKVDNAMFPMDQYENVLIRHIDFVIPEEFEVSVAC